MLLSHVLHGVREKGGLILLNAKICLVTRVLFQLNCAECVVDMS